MRTAADGYPFDIDDAGEAGIDEVEIIQFIRPNARRRRMIAKVGEDLAKSAQDLIISAEDLGGGQVAVYVRAKEEHPDKEHVSLATNGPGPDNPTAVLQRMIRRYEHMKRRPE
jgi:hypothetical protein